MIRFSFLAMILTLTAPLHAGAAQEAQAAWAKRDQAGETERAIALWKEALKQNPEDTNIYISLTKACGRAYRNAQNSKDRRQWADRAREYGAQAVEKNPQNSNAHAEYAEALGQWAQAHKGLRGLMMVKQAVAELNKAVELDPSNAYAHMILASIYREAPSAISVGDKRKALQHARLAAEYGPGYAINHLVLARVYLDMGKKTDAAHELKTITALTPPADAVPETRADQDTAREMLREKNL